MPLQWSSQPTATKPTTASSTPPKGNLQWSTNPTMGSFLDTEIPEVTSFSQKARDVLGMTPNVERQQEIASRYVAGESGAPEMIAQTAMNTVGAFVAPVIKGLGKVLGVADYVASGKGAYNPIPENNPYTAVKPKAISGYDKAVDVISDQPSIQNYANSEQSKSFEEYLRGANDLLAISPLPKVTAGLSKTLSAAEQFAIQEANKLKTARADKSLMNIVNEVKNIEDNYTGLAKKNDFVTDKVREDSLTRIAQSNVLVDTVGTDGKISRDKIGGAVQAYKAQTIDGAEGVVRENLVREGATVNINEVVSYLRRNIEASKLAPDALETALTSGLNKIARGLMRKADEFGNILLEHIHDSKINTTAGIDYLTPATTKTYRKAIARSFREIVENKSKTNVKEVNTELGKYYGDIERIQNLADKRVEGGKLGKYTARIGGNIAGAIAGQALGPLGAVGGALVGGEVSSAIKGAQMASTFGKDTGTRLAENQVLTEAKAQASKPKERDLSKPDPKVGANKSIPKDKEILRLEGAIADNVKAQKEAIKAKDWQLVAKLKETYDYLVSKLKEAINKIKNTPNKSGGFANFGADIKGSSKSGKPRPEAQSKSLQSSDDATTHLQKAQVALREAKGLSPSDIMAKHPDINLKRDVPITDVRGNKAVIPAGEALTPYELKGNKVLLQDGKTYIVSKNQWQNIKGQAVSGEAKPFAPELAGTEETVHGSPSKSEVDALLNDEMGQGMTRKEAEEYLMNDEEYLKTKFSSYTLPDGKNYKEILIKAPQPEANFQDFRIEKLDYDTNKPYRVVSPNSTSHFATNAEAEVELAKIKKTYGAIQQDNASFKSSHWDEPNVISHLRMNERTYNGKKVSFMEELQSDWAREARKAPKTSGFDLGEPSDYADGAVPSHPLLKNWQVPTVKRALQEAVANGSEYFSWINGEQTSARYNLATHVDNVEWKNAQKQGEKIINITPTGGSGLITAKIDASGKVVESAGATGGQHWTGKSLDEVLGKGLADSIMSKESGTLSGEGLKFGGEWANTLYDKQVKNIVEDVTGGKVIEMDLGLPVEKKGTNWYTADQFQHNVKPSDLKVGKEITKQGNGNYFSKSDTYTIIEVMGDGKFKVIKSDYYGPYKKYVLGGEEDFLAIQPERYIESFDISTKTTLQQGLKLTPEIIARIKGEAPVLKKPSGKSPI